MSIIQAARISALLGNGDSVDVASVARSRAEFMRSNWDSMFRNAMGNAEQRRTFVREVVMTFGPIDDDNWPKSFLDLERKSDMR